MKVYSHLITFLSLGIAKALNHTNANALKSKIHYLEQKVLELEGNSEMCQNTLDSFINPHDSIDPNPEQVVDRVFESIREVRRGNKKARILRRETIPRVEVDFICPGSYCRNR